MNEWSAAAKFDLIFEGADRRYRLNHRKLTYDGMHDTWVLEVDIGQPLSEGGLMMYGKGSVEYLKRVITEKGEYRFSFKGLLKKKKDTGEIIGIWIDKIAGEDLAWDGKERKVDKSIPAGLQVVGAFIDPDKNGELPVHSDLLEDEDLMKSPLTDWSGPLFPKHAPFGGLL